MQGVWFRASTQKKAVELGILGTVQNRSDGSVYIEAEGETSNLQAFIDWCQAGPTHARVDRMEEKALPLQHFSDFQILR